MVAFAVQLLHNFVNQCHKCKVLLILRGSIGFKEQRSFKGLMDIVFYQTSPYHVLILVWTLLFIKQ